MEVADLYVTLRGVAGEFNRSMDEAGLAAGRADGKIAALTARSKTLALGTAAAAVAIGAVSVKMASDFQTQMTRLYTAAGAPRQAVLESYSAVLQIGNDVGMTGTKIAEALYHPISAGLDLATSLQVVKYAAEEANISGASLDDTTYSLSSVMKAFNLPATQAGATMAKLNAIVGEGDMRFQDFNESIKNWTPTSAAMGISITSMGAGLAYLTDRGMTAEVASTRLTMGLALMTTPSRQAAKLLETLGVASGKVTAGSSAMAVALAKSGITQVRLADDLRKPDGLYVALSDLQTAMRKTGASSNEVDSIIGKIFGGGRSDKAIMSLLQNLGALQTKYQSIERDSTAKHFQEAWAETQKNFSFRVHQMLADVENLAIRLGLLLIPVLTRIMDAVQGVIRWFGKHKQAAAELGNVIKTVLIGALIAAGIAVAGMLAEFVVAAAPFIAIAAVIGLIARKLYELYEHNAKFRAFVNRIAADVKAGFGKVIDWFKANWPEIHKVIEQVFTVISRIVSDVVDWFSTNWPAIWRITKEVFEDIYNVISTIIGAVVGFIQQHKVVIEKIFSDIGKTAMALVDAFKAAFDMVKGAVEVVVNIVTDLWDRFGKHMVDHIVVALRTIWTFFTGIFDAIVHFFRGVVNIITGVFQAFAGIFTGHWSKFWGGIEKIFAGIWQVITAIFRGVWTTITAIVKIAMNAVSTAIGAGMAAISAAWGLVWHMIGTLLTAVWNGVIKPIFAGFKTVAIDPTIAAFHLLQNAFGVAWNAIKAILSAAWNNVIKPIFGFINTVAIKPLMTSISAFESAWKAVWDGVQGAIESVWRVIKPILDTIKRAIDDTIGAIGKVTGMAGKIGGGIVHGVGKVLSIFDVGGWTPGPAGAPSPAIVHGGEYVLSTGMLAGRQNIDPAVMSALFANGMKNAVPGQQTGGMVNATPARATGGFDNGVAPISIVVQGSIIDVDGLFAALRSNPSAFMQLMQRAGLRHGSINSQTWAPYARGGAR